MGTPSFYTKRADEVAATQQQLAAIEKEIRAAYGRWAELDALAAGERD
jgi:hypothetical protein